MIFDVTLHGFTALCNQNMSDHGDNLVNWVHAPSRDALDKFLKNHKLNDRIESVTPCCDPGDEDNYSYNYVETHEDGIDLFVDEGGNVVSTNDPDWFNTWTRLQDQYSQYIIPNFVDR